MAKPHQHLLGVSFAVLVGWSAVALAEDPDCSCGPVIPMGEMVAGSPDLALGASVELGFTFDSEKNACYTVTCNTSVDWLYRQAAAGDPVALHAVRYIDPDGIRLARYSPDITPPAKCHVRKIHGNFLVNTPEYVAIDQNDIRNCGTIRKSLLDDEFDLDKKKKSGKGKT